VVACRIRPKPAEQVDLRCAPLAAAKPFSPDQMRRTAAGARSAAREPWGGLFSQTKALISDQLRRFKANQDFYADPWKLAPQPIEPSATALLKTGSAAGAAGRPGQQPQPQTATPWWWRPALPFLGELYGDVFDPVLPASPKRLGEWRAGRGLPWAGREDSAPNSASAVRAARCCPDRSGLIGSKNGGELPHFIVIDASSRWSHPDSCSSRSARFSRHRQPNWPRRRPGSGDRATPARNPDRP